MQRTHGNTALSWEPVPQQRKSKVTRKRARRKPQSGKVMLILMVAIMGGVFLYRCGVLMDVNAQYSRQKQALEAITSLVTQANIELERTVDLKTVEAKAQEKGMRKPADSQIFFVNMKRVNFAETTEPQTEGFDIFKLIGSFFGKS